MTGTLSLWATTAPTTRFPRLERDEFHVDVAIVGGGITGVTAALLLKQAGKRVALLEARQIASGTTGGTTAHLTEVLDTRYYEIERKFGRDGAAKARHSSRAAIERIATLVDQLGVECAFERVPGYLYTEDEAGVEELEQEAAAAERAGLSVQKSGVPLPIATKAGLCFEDQAQFQPVAYVTALATAIPGKGSYVFEQARVLTVDEGEPCQVHLEGGQRVTAERVILATHAPLNRVLLETKIAQYRSYVVSGPVNRAPAGLFWDTQDPYHYLRVHSVGEQKHLIVGGADHKTGAPSDTEFPFKDLAQYASRFGLNSIEQRWSAQVVEPVDGLPFIGRNALSERVYVATGFSGNGMTFGTLAAMMLCDACLDRDNPYAELYAATRIKPLASFTTYLGENIDFPLHLLSDVVRPPDVRGVDELAPGEGKIVRVQGERLAVYRDEGGRLHALSPVCTHLGCHVNFNATEKTWDCPCHGSRFGVDGKVLEGPAVRALASRDTVK